MDDSSDAAPVTDRRNGDRRVKPDEDYAGAERRRAERRALADRRKSPRAPF